MLNPSHLLIARNGPLRSPAEPHITAPGLARQPVVSGVPYARREVVGHATRRDAADASFDSTEESPAIPRPADSLNDAHERIAVHPTFQRSDPPSRWDGTVQLRVQREVFWCHAEVLYFASPFFEGVLSGE